MKSIIILLIISAIVFFVYRFIAKRFKLPHLNAVNVVIGEIKSGKSITSLALALKEYKKRVRIWKVREFFCKLFNREVDEFPLFYSSIPVGIDYVPMTQELLYRKKRFRYGSVVFLDEVSFTADKMLYKYKSPNGNTEEEVQIKAKTFFKLFGHETGGYGALGHGILVCNTQSVSDCSKEVRACIGSCLFVEKIFASFILPIFGICYCRQERYSEDNMITNTYNEDLEKSMCKFLFKKKYFKYYDKACFSKCTDSLPVEDTIIHGASLKDLKTDKVVSFGKLYDLGGKND